MTTELTQPVTDQAAVLLAPNAGPMTLDGTNSYVLRGNGSVCLRRGRSRTRTIRGIWPRWTPPGRSS